MMAVAHSAPMASVGSNPGSNVTGFVSTVGTRTATNGGSEAPMSAKEKLQRAQKLFTDSHSSDMVERQVAAIMRICEQNQAGLLLQDLENLHPIVTLCNERIAQAEKEMWETCRVYLRIGAMVLPSPDCGSVAGLAKLPDMRGSGGNLRAA